MSKPTLTEAKWRTLLFQSVGFTFCLDINIADISKVSHRSVDKGQQRTLSIFSRVTWSKENLVNSRETSASASQDLEQLNFYFWSILKPPGDAFIEATFFQR